MGKLGNTQTTPVNRENMSAQCWHCVAIHQRAVQLQP